MPGVPCPLCLDRRHRTRGQTKLGRERCASYLDHTHGVDRQLDGILACHRIGAVRVVERQRALIAATAADVEQPVWPSHDAGNEREGVLKPFARNRRRLHHARGDSIDTSNWTAVDEVLACDNIDFLVKSFDVELQRKAFDSSRLHRHRFHRGFETLQLRDDRTVAGWNVRKPKLARFTRDVDARFQTGARQRQRHPWHQHRLTIWRWQRDRTRNRAGRGLRRRSAHPKGREEEGRPADTRQNPHANGRGKERAQSIWLTTVRISLSLPSDRARTRLKPSLMTARLCAVRSSATKQEAHSRIHTSSGTRNGGR